MKTHDLLKMFKALASEQRLNLFLLLAEWCGSNPFEEGVEKCFTRACRSLNLSRSTISHHFKQLQDAGLITCWRKGQSVVCQINEEAIQAIQDFPIIQQKSAGVKKEC